MKLTTRGHYSVKALLDLSLQQSNTPVSVKEIAVRQDIPATYLEKLLIEMRRGGLVVSFRGAHGGYQLAKLPAQISLGEILESVGETIELLVTCGDDGKTEVPVTVNIDDIKVMKSEDHSPDVELSDGISFMVLFLSVGPCSSDDSVLFLFIPTDFSSFGSSS